MGLWVGVRGKAHHTQCISFACLFTAESRMGPGIFWDREDSLWPGPGAQSGVISAFTWTEGLVGFVREIMELGFVWQGHRGNRETSAVMALGTVLGTR